MEIKRKNVFLFMTMACLIVLLCRPSDIADRIDLVFWLPYYMNDPAYGMMVLGLICVTIMAVAKVISGR